jgi:cytochrome P450
MSQRTRPPRLKGNIISGSYFDFFSNQLDFLTDCARTHGDVVAFRFFHLPIFLISNPDLIEEVFAGNSSAFKKAKTVKMPSQRMLFGNSLIASEGEEWLRQRRAMQPAFNQSHLSGYADLIVEITLEHIKNWKDGDVLRIDHELVDLTFKLAARTFFGIEGTEGKEIIRDLIDLNKSVFSGQNRIAWFVDNFLPTPKHVKFRRAIKRVDELIARLIRERRSGASDQKDLLSVLLSIKNSETGSLTDKQLRDEIVTAFIAGNETTAVALSWVWVMLARHPDEFTKLGHELETVLSGRAPEFADLRELKHTARVLKETLRLYPPNRSTAREAVKDCRLGGFAIPAGSQVVMPQWVVHRDERFFDHPDEFIPDRWTTEFEQQLHKYAYFPFGSGPRLCIGRSFAVMEMALVIATIATRFEISLDSDDEIEPLSLVLLRPKNDLVVTLRSLSAT